MDQLDNSNLAVILDMDGVISDTQTGHSLWESRFLAEYGISLSPAEITARFAGLPRNEWMPQIFGKLIDPDKLRLILADKCQDEIRAASREVKEIPGVRKLIYRLSRAEFNLAVASSGHYDYVETVLDTLSLSKFFPVVVGGNMVARRKPYPDCFLRAAKNLDILPENCLVIEDSRNGMQAAISAGMACIGLVDDLEKDYPTGLLVNTLADITPAKISHIINIHKF